MKYLFWFFYFASFNLSAQWSGASGEAGGIYRSGNVSIGTSAASNDEMLGIEGTGHWQIRLKDVGSGGSDWRIGSTSNDWYIGGGKFAISNTSFSTDAALIIDPEKNMTVAGKVQASAFQKNTFGYALTMKYGGAESSGWQIGRDGASGAGWMHFDYNEVEKIRINPDGYVGIGTPSPTAKLEVRGGIKISDIQGGGHNLIINNGYGGAFNTAEEFSYIAKFRGNTVLGAYDALVVTGGFNGGKVGIGTVNPDAPLTVKGIIHTNEVRVDLNAPIEQGPDYVFEKDYNLLPLAELEAYIKANKHLPEVPSAKEMEAEGLKLKEMNLLLLKKVEELTLHLIEANKKIEETNQKVTVLEGKVGVRSQE